MILKTLRPDQYRQVAEWEFGPQPDGADWQRYADEMNAPQWAHFALYDGAAFVGCISLEWVDSQTIAGHVVTARRSVHPDALTKVLLNVAAYLFTLGNTSLVAQFPRDKRAAAILALRCGMLEEKGTDMERRFILTKTRYDSRRIDSRLAPAA